NHLKIVAETTSTTLRNPRGIFIDEINSTLFVADCGNDRIQSFQLDSFLGKTIFTNQIFHLNCPSGITLDKQSFRCLVGCDRSAGISANQLNYPSSLSFDSFGNLFVVDQQNHRIQKFNLNNNLENVSCEYSCLNTTISKISTIVFYTFDNNTFDTVGNYSMNETFPVSYVPGWIGLAVNFIYTDYKYLSTKSHIPLNNRSFTIDFWFYTTNLTGFKDLIFVGECQSSTNDHRLCLNVRYKLLRLVFFSDDTFAKTNLMINRWYHATFVYDSTVKQQLIYLNGVLDRNRTTSNHLSVTVALFTIGGGSAGGDSSPFVYYSGSIDHFGISYRVKSPCEIYLNAILFCYFQFESFSPLIDSGPNLINAINSNGIQTIGRVVGIVVNVSNGCQASNTHCYSESTMPQKCSAVFGFDFYDGAYCRQSTWWSGRGDLLPNGYPKDFDWTSMTYRTVTNAKNQGLHDTNFNAYACSERFAQRMSATHFRFDKKETYHDAWDTVNDDLLIRLVSKGPVTIAINADFMGGYGDGVHRGSCPPHVNHAVLLTGWDTDAQTGVPFWPVKNSWSTRWDKNGFARFERKPGQNQCFIYHEVTRPTAI
ncbi:unnamed protein product, partial [Adineta ricciae]